MSKHTPGPWREISAEIEGADGSKIGQLYARPEDNETWGAGVADANSRLVCAAPDLLIVLKKTLDHAVGHACDARGLSPEECNEWPWVQEAQAAIAKAGGAK